MSSTGNSMRALGTRLRSLLLIAMSVVLFLLARRVAADGSEAEIRPVLVEKDAQTTIEFHAGLVLIGLAPERSPCGLELRLPGVESIPLRFARPSMQSGRLEFGPIRHGPLTLTMRDSSNTATIPVR